MSVFKKQKSNDINISLEEYAREKKVGELFKRLMQEVIFNRPLDPLQFLIDNLKREANSFTKIVVIGKTCSGKKTVAEQLLKDLGGCVHLNYERDLLFSIDAKQVLSAGEIPGECVAKNLEKKMKSEHRNKGWIVSGAPFTRAQMLGFQQMGLSPDHLVYLNVHDEIALKRASTLSLPLDKMGDALEAFSKHIPDVIEFYGKLGIVHEINANCSKLKVLADSKRALQGRPSSPFFVVLGKPGAGKTTQSQRIAKAFGLVHINLQQVVTEDAYGISSGAHNYLNKGQNVPDSLMFSILIDRLSRPDCTRKGFVLDGFALGLKFVDELAQCGYYPDKVVLLEVEDSVISKRASEKSSNSDIRQSSHIKPSGTSSVDRNTGSSDDKNHFQREIHELALEFKEIIINVNADDIEEKVNSRVMLSLHGIPTDRKIICITGIPGLVDIGAVTSLLLEQDESFAVINPWSLISYHIQHNTQLGLLLGRFTLKTIPDSLLSKVILEQMQQTGSVETWLIESFPQTPNQASTALLDAGLIPTGVIVMEHKSKMKNEQELQDIEIMTESVSLLSNYCFVRKVQCDQILKKIVIDLKHALRNEKNPLKVIIIGPPAVGKGTQCEHIKQHYGVVHLSTGEMLRQAVQEQTEIGITARKYMDNGLLVPDSLILDMVNARIMSSDCKDNGWLLDGFPRSAAQAEFMVKHNILPDIVILLLAPDEVVVERISGRRTDPATGNVYHVTYQPPPIDIAEEVKKRWVQRSDDTEEKIKVRLAQYHANLQGILQHFKGMKVSIKGDEAKEIVTAEVTRALDEVCKSILYQTV